MAGYDKFELLSHDYYRAKPVYNNLPREPHKRLLFSGGRK